MNIKQAKEQIRNTLRAYLSRDELGNYRIPAVRQRPVLLIGPPGIGKTQIMEQIAAEENVGLVSYTITHHTRQSAIGLPQRASEGLFQAGHQTPAANIEFLHSGVAVIDGNAPLPEQGADGRFAASYATCDNDGAHQCTSMQSNTSGST